MDISHVIMQGVDRIGSAPPSATIAQQFRVGGEKTEEAEK